MNSVAGSASVTKPQKAFLEGAKAASDGIPTTMCPYLKDRHLRIKWLDGWEQTHTFRQKNIEVKKKLMRQNVSAIK
jgi:ribosome modulation factor